MAKVLNNPFGQLSGKLGGVVFSRNKSGSIVRANVKGINPRTAAQVAARDAFGYAAQLFKNISSEYKTLWQEWANNFYKPRNGSNSGQFSGYNAFVALRNVVTNGVERGEESKMEWDETVMTGLAFTNFLQMPSPPIAKDYSALVAGDGGGADQTLSLNSVQLTQSGDVEFDLQVGDGAGNNIQGFISPEGYDHGLAVFVSNGNTNQGMTYQNPEAQLLHMAKPVDVTSSPEFVANTVDINIKFEDSVNIGKFRAYPLVDEYALVSVYCVNKYGQLAKIGSEEVKVTLSLV